MIGANDVTHRIDKSVAVRHLAQAVPRACATLGAEVVVGTCPDLGTIEPVAQPLRLLARRWSRDLAAAQTVAVVEAGGRTVSLGDLLGPEFAERPHEMFSADRFHPSPAGYARAAAALLPSVCAALGIWPASGDGGCPTAVAARASSRSPRRRPGRARPRHRGQPDRRSPGRPRSPRAAGPCCCAAPPRPRPTGATDAPRSTEPAHGRQLAAVRAARLEPRRRPAAAASDGGRRRRDASHARQATAIPSSSRLSAAHPRRPRRTAVPEAVIVSTARTPDRPGVQGLAQGRPPRRPRRLQVISAALAKVPALDPASSRTSTWAAPSRGASTAPTWPASSPCWPGYDHLPGRHGQPVLRLVGADHPDGLPRDQGRRGRRLHLAPASSASRATTTSPAPAAPRPTGRTRGSPTPRPAARGPPRTTRPGPTRARTASCPTSTSRWARPPRTSPTCAGISRERQDEWGVSSQNRAEKAIADGFFAREITPVTTPDGTVVSTDDGPRAGRDAREACPGLQAGVPRARARSRPATAARSTTAPPPSSS